MANYIPYNYDQSVLVAINFKDQLQPGTFESAVHYLVDNRLDLSSFDKVYKNDDTGRPAYDPAILLKIVLFAYSKGITSSREIQWCCRNNIIFFGIVLHERTAFHHHCRVCQRSSGKSREAV